MSFVYSEDVGSLLRSVIDSPDPLALANEAYNVAWPDPVSFRQFYSTITAFLPIGKPFKLERADGTEDEAVKPHFFPSVTRGVKTWIVLLGFFFERLLFFFVFFSSASCFFGAYR